MNVLPATSTAPLVYPPALKVAKEVIDLFRKGAFEIKTSHATVSHSYTYLHKISNVCLLAVIFALCILVLVGLRLKKAQLKMGIPSENIGIIIPCQQKENAITTTNLFRNQIRDLIKGRPELNDIFQKNVFANPSHIVTPSEPISCGDKRILLEQKYTNAVRELRELMRFIAIHRDVWKVFVKSIMTVNDEHSKNLQTFFQTIFLTLKSLKEDMRIKNCYEPAEFNKIARQCNFDEESVQIALLKIVNNVFAFNVFWEAFLGHAKLTHSQAIFINSSLASCPSGGCA